MKGLRSSNIGVLECAALFAAVALQLSAVLSVLQDHAPARAGANAAALAAHR